MEEGSGIAGHCLPVSCLWLAIHAPAIRCVADDDVHCLSHQKAPWNGASGRKIGIFVSLQSRRGWGSNHTTNVSEMLKALAVVRFHASGSTDVSHLEYSSSGFLPIFESTRSESEASRKDHILDLETEEGLRSTLLRVENEASGSGLLFPSHEIPRVALLPLNSSLES